MKNALSLVILVLVLGGCASGITRPQGAPAEHSKLSANNQVAAISVSLTNDARKKATENLKFNSDELLSHVKRALEINSLLNSATDKARPNLEIQVKDMRVRSNFSAIMWGFMAGADSISADVLLKDATGKELDRFEVSVSYALGGLGGGQDTTRMSWLYEKFAEETVKELVKQ